MPQAPKASRVHNLNRISIIPVQSLYLRFENYLFQIAWSLAIAQDFDNVDLSETYSMNCIGFGPALPLAALQRVRHRNIYKVSDYNSSGLWPLAFGFCLSKDIRSIPIFVSPVRDPRSQDTFGVLHCFHSHS